MYVKRVTRAKLAVIAQLAGWTLIEAMDRMADRNIKDLNLEKELEVYLSKKNRSLNHDPATDDSSPVPAGT